ncbi:protein NO VEIN domain-containing protein [Streptosporangium amethystogenes subsp. fukuiense]|uniref:Protein NO VEIN domain-containing protein n=1 Tax=Streptosporangium amethystogenes subsp. fukuiense TaxID=698418 RepID=A0ABW2TBY1_9ACTN
MQPTTDDGRQMNANFSIEGNDGRLSLVMNSSGGKSPSGARNGEYNPALELLLDRLRNRGATLISGFVESSKIADLPEGERRLFDQKIHLPQHEDMERVRFMLTTPQGKIGKDPNAKKDGNNRKRIRLYLDVPGYAPEDHKRLANDIANPDLNNVEVAPQELRPVSPAVPVMLVETEGTPTRSASLSRGGAGRVMSAARRLAIEQHAVGMATELYESQGYQITDVGTTESYDLHAVRESGDRHEELHIEVKGSINPADAVELTKGEVRNAREHHTHLVVVDCIEVSSQPDGKVETSGGRLRQWETWVPAEEDLQATRYRYRLPGDGQAPHS